MITRENFEKYCKENNLRYEINCSIFENYLDEDWNHHIFIVICGYGFLETAQWLYNSENIDIHYENELAFRYSCLDRHLDLAKWLIEISKENGKIINIHVNNEEVFRKSCNNGDLEVAKWLFEISKENNDMINIHANDEEAFIWCCLDEDIEMAKWLVEISKENDEIINIHTKNEMIFRLSCFSGFIEIVKWLMDNKTIYFVNCFVSKIIWRKAPNDFDISKENGEIINIHTNNEEAFRNSCFCGQQSNLLCKLLCFQNHLAQSAK